MAKILVIVVAAIALGALNSTAMGVAITTNNVKMEDGIADFGRGTAHNNGTPDLPGRVAWDFTPNASGVLIATATVTGTLFLDTCFGGHVHLKITYHSNQAGAAALDTDTEHARNDCGFCGQCANNSANQEPVNQSFSGSTLHRVVLQLFSVSSSGAEDVLGPAVVINSPDRRLFSNVTINNNPRIFQNASVDFQRSNGNMQGTIRGRLFMNVTAGTVRLITDFQAFDGALLQRVITDRTVTSLPTSDNVNFSSTASAVQGKLFRIRLRVGIPAVLNGVQTVASALEQNFDFLGGVNTGTFQLAPVDAVVGVGQRLNYAFTWTVPNPLNWHDLEALRLRILDGSDVVISVYFDEATQTFALYDEATDKFSQAYPAGSNQRLQTPNATLFLRDSGLQASGPTSPSVTLYLSLSLKSSLAGKWLAVEVAANDDEGNQGGFEPAGSITVYY